MCLSGSDSRAEPNGSVCSIARSYPFGQLVSQLMDTVDSPGGSSILSCSIVSLLQVHSSRPILRAIDSPSLSLRSVTLASQVCVLADIVIVQ